MFKRLAKSGLADFRFGDFKLGGFRQPRRAELRAAGLFNQSPSNDNLPGVRRPKGRRPIPTPVLACHWIDRNGRLECRWQLDPLPQTAPEGPDAERLNEPILSCKRSRLAVAAICET
jgi:hypothetical protein